MLLEMLADTDKKKRKTLNCTTHLIHFLHCKFKRAVSAPNADSAL